jgi:hypothetical protein
MAEAYFKDDPDYANFVTPTFECYKDDEVPASKMLDIDDIKDKDDIDTYDQYVGDQVRVPIEDEIRTSRVIWLERELNGPAKG